MRSVRGQRFKLIHNLQSDNEFGNLITASPWFQRELTVEKSVTVSNYSDFVKRPEFELYDVVNDLFERVNLIHKPEHLQKILHLQQKLTAWMTQQGDLGVVMERVVCERKAFPHGPCGGKKKKTGKDFNKMTFY